MRIDKVTVPGYALDSGLIYAAQAQARSRANREQRPMVIYATHRPAIGRGDGLAVRPQGEPAPLESVVIQTVQPDIRE